MQLSHTLKAASVVFDEPNLVSAAGLVPLLGLAEAAGLAALAQQHLTVPTDKGANAGSKVASLVAGMVAGADSIDDMRLLRHGGMGRVFTGCYAASTLGSFLRSFRFGHVRQLDAVAARFLVGLAARAPLLPAGDEPGGLVLVDIDDTIVEVHGYAKQGAGFGYSKVRGLNALLATATTSQSAPVVVAQRLRKGAANSARGARRLAADALAAVARVAPGRPVLLRADSAFYGCDTITTAAKAGAQVSVTVKQTAPVRAAIGAIPDQAWTPIAYREAVFDEASGRWIARAEVAEVPFVAFTSRPTSQQVPGRLVVRRIPELNPTGQDGLFELWRFHAFFTTSDLDTVVADKTNPPRPRHHRASPRRLEELRPGPPAQRPVHRERGLAGAGGDGVQSDPRRRCPERHAAGQGDHWHDPPHPDRRPGPRRDLRPTADAASPEGLALAAGLEEAVHPDLRATRPGHHLTTPAGEPAHPKPP